MILRLTTAGLLARAIGGQLLFWISYLNLPFARSLQLGNGFWFFSLDGIYYHATSVKFAHAGLVSIAAMPRDFPSVAYIQILSVLALLTGDSPAVGLLMNLYCYLLTCVLILRWRASGDSTARVKEIAIAAVSLSPAAILWSMQPLKDIFFVFLITAIVGACAAWARAAESDRPRLLLTLSALLVVCMWVLSGVRWYVGFAELLAFLVFFPMVVFKSRRKLLVSAVSLVLLESCNLALVAGGGPYVPHRLASILNPGFKDALATPAAVGALPQLMTASVTKARSGFEEGGGATIIRGGALLPASRQGNLMAGAISVILPHLIGQPLGIVNIQGGRGLWLYSDLDTIVFDIVLGWAFWSVLRAARARRPGRAEFWLMLFLLLALGGPLIYACANFGSLFRLRGIIYTMILLIPLTLGIPSAEPGAVPTAEPIIAGERA